MRRQTSLLWLFLLLVVTNLADATQQRYFEFTYTTNIAALPDDAERLQLWLPYPTSTPHQIIDDVRIDAPYPIRITREPEYGNSILYIHAEQPLTTPFTVQMQFRVLRKEQHTEEDAKIPQRERERLLGPDNLVPIDGLIAELSREATQGKTSRADRARAIYDYVTRSMSYDKSGVGWGRGDALYACDVGKGNCTDFHSLIIGMARADNIPGVFEIGFPLPASSSEGNIGGYHCWAQLHVPGQGWVPMDSSEASKHPEQFEYFYGNLDANRVQFTRGRDITLQPAQAGPKLNYFIYPYLEIDGKPHDGVERRFHFRDLPLPDWTTE